MYTSNEIETYIKFAAYSTITMQLLLLLLFAEEINCQEQE